MIQRVEGGVIEVVEGGVIEVVIEVVIEEEERKMKWGSSSGTQRERERDIVRAKIL